VSQALNTGGAQFRADHPSEQEAVRTTIVGGRPPGSGQKVGPIPRGLEILLRKASVDPEFKELLLRDRAAAAESIGLGLEPGEAMMLAAAPRDQLEAVIARTTVPQEHRRAFLGQAAAAMLAAMGAGSSVMAVERIMPAPGGVAPDRPPAPSQQPPFPVAGVPAPPKKEKTLAEQVIEVIAKRTHVDAKKIQLADKLAKDLAIKPDDLSSLREDLAKRFAIKAPAADFKEIGTVGETIEFVDKALKKRAPKPVSPMISRGVRPDVPPTGTRGGTRPE
jgi:acyl carrier protein